MNSKRRKQRAVGVGSSAVLGRRRILSIPINNSASERLRVRLALRAVNDCGVQLAEMLNYPGPVAALMEALKREGVRFDKNSLPDKDITYLNPYVAIIRGAAAEFLHCARESLKGRSTTHQSAQDGGLLINGSRRILRGDHHRNVRKTLFNVTHKRSRPNDPKLSHADGRAAPLAR
jgi:hypothetical protein